ncbi:alpha/beta fold hydrolase [Actinocrispum wychmicini]|uniref:Pimeloyl-ACP methyl ester carboxylesterase n=1 Tax=Actinocrispum wychmicini TaxID=1213861 RepID=A0A4R2JZL5_9PSEU|nr:alpha/beta hydrolase [Actinocrispum wychmicini]TCO59575.1 pimeloyl-ACP methyl ester carboxylesterase [Actinocrispum wychmicini]
MKANVPRRGIVGTTLAITAMAGATLLSGSATAGQDFAGPKPTILLVHGAFTDASSWSGVITNLQHAGYPVVAPPNPLRDLTTDAAYIAGITRNIKGPVIMVGHSYGGAVITNAAREAPNVKGLVYVAAFAPDNGESTGDINKRYPDTPIRTSIVPQLYPDGTVDLYIDPAKFRDVFAQDVPADRAAVMAAVQRPLNAPAGDRPSGEPAWKKLPSWFLTATEDHAINPAAEADMAKRAHAVQTVKIRGGHALPVSHPNDVARLIRTAACQTRQQ